MKIFFVTILTLAFLLFSSFVSLAWSSPGHMAIAAVAFRDITETDKKTINEILTHHPNYAKWKISYEAGASNLDLETFVFMQASIWPDQIRRRGNQYDHPEWHYIDYPLEPPTFPEKPDASPTNNILYGINQSEKLFENQRSSPEDRAVYLSWLIHLVGDIHQPLHCATLINPDYPAPIGDKGGNSFYVRPAEAAVNLHSIWDKALGSAINPREQFNYAIEICAKYPQKTLLEIPKHKTPESWSVESREIAIENGYLHGNLKGSKNKDNAPALPENYTQNLKSIAERQAALAGHRLAIEIKKCLQ